MNFLDSFIKDVECNAVMGVFPEVNRAWVSIDSDIYFWRYEDGLVDGYLGSYQRSMMKHYEKIVNG